MAGFPSCQEEVMDVHSYSASETSFCQVEKTTLEKWAFPWPKVHDPHTREMRIQEKISKTSAARSFQKAVVLVIAVEKMKHYSKATIFTDDDLMDIMSTVFEPVDFDSCECTYVADPLYHFSRAISYDIQDIEQKSFILGEPTQLVALHLQGPNARYAVRLRMHLYRPNLEDRAGSVPVALNIKGGKLYLSCVQKGDQPVLQLEEANIQGDLDKSKLGRFLFYKVEIKNHTRFESAAFPHWYICTSSRPNEPVGMTNRIGEVFIVDYKVGEKLPSA